MGFDQTQFVKTSGGGGGSTVPTYTSLKAVDDDITAAVLAEGDKWRIHGTDSVLGAYDIEGEVYGGQPSWRGWLPSSVIGGTWSLVVIAGTNTTVTKSTDADGRPIISTTGGVAVGNDVALLHDSLLFEAPENFGLLIDYTCAATPGGDTVMGSMLAVNTTEASNYVRAQLQFSASAWKNYCVYANAGAVTYTGLVTTPNSATAGKYSSGLRTAMGVMCHARTETSTGARATYHEAAGSAHSTMLTLGTNHNSVASHAGPAYRPGVIVNQVSNASAKIIGITCEMLRLPPTVP